MTEKKHLHLLWNNADPITAENMVFMYVTNSLFHCWWEEVTLIIWGEPLTELLKSDEKLLTI